MQSFEGRLTMRLIVADEEFERGAKRISDMSEELNEIFNNYSTVILELKKEGICDIAINNVLTAKLEKLMSYGKEFNEISAFLVKKTETFLVDIDEADAYLYD
jgi:hypothetical protein